MQNEFILVKSKRKRRKTKTSIGASPVAPEDTIDNNKLLRKLSYIVDQLETDYFTEDLLTNIESILKAVKAFKIDNILCYGLGKFSESHCSVHQLALLVFLEKKFNSSVEVFDPAFSNIEVSFLKNLKFSVIQCNEEGKRIIDSNKVTLVFLPHCPKQLINNFLWANWNSCLEKCIIISNSFSKILENNTKKIIVDSANYIEKSFTFCTEVQLKENYEFPNVFNDISIHYFHNLESHYPLFQSQAEEPKYLEDTEFITKEIEKLTIENEQ